MQNKMSLIWAQNEWSESPSKTHPRAILEHLRLQSLICNPKSLSDEVSNEDQKQLTDHHCHRLNMDATCLHPSSMGQKNCCFFWTSCTSCPCTNCLLWSYTLDNSFTHTNFHTTRTYKVAWRNYFFTFNKGWCIKVTQHQQAQYNRTLWPACHPCFFCWQWDLTSPPRC